MKAKYIGSVSGKVAAYGAEWEKGKAQTVPKDFEHKVEANPDFQVVKGKQSDKDK